MKNKIFKYNFGTKEKPKELEFSFKIKQIEVFEEAVKRPILGYITELSGNLISGVSSKDVISLIKAFALPSKHLERRSDEEIHYLLENGSMLEFTMEINKALLESVLGVDTKSPEAKKKVQVES